MPRLFFFNDTATTEIYTLSLHDALPISDHVIAKARELAPEHPWMVQRIAAVPTSAFPTRSEEHTSELQSQSNLVCRLLLEKKKKNKIKMQINILIHAAGQSTMIAATSSS